MTNSQSEAISLKRPRTQDERPAPDRPFGRSRKRRRVLAEVSPTAVPSPSASSDDGQHPIAFWAANGQWSRHHLHKSEGMDNMKPVKKYFFSTDKGGSEGRSSTGSSSGQTRDQKGSEYGMTAYPDLLKIKGVFMQKSAAGVSDASKKLCRELLEKDQMAPQDTLFDDDVFWETCTMLEGRNEQKIVQDISRLIVPFAEVLAIRDEQLHRGLVESVNEGWNKVIPITSTRPQPDYAVGFRREAFTPEQQKKLQPFVGDNNELSYILAAWYMCFPFLTCEVKSSTVALEIADRQNAHSAAIAVRSVVQLFRALKREKKLHREILAFSVSHDHANVRIYGHYAETDGAEPRYYRYLVHAFAITALDGKEKWTAYQFTKNIYGQWVPKHFARMCLAIDQLPQNEDSEDAQPEPRPSVPSSGLSQRFGAYSVAESSIDPDSVDGRNEAQSSPIQDPVATLSTSVTGAVFNKPRLDGPRRGGQQRPQRTKGKAASSRIPRSSSIRRPSFKSVGGPVRYVLFR